MNTTSSTTTTVRAIRLTPCLPGAAAGGAAGADGGAAAGAGVAAAGTDCGSLAIGVLVAGSHGSARRWCGRGGVLRRSAGYRQRRDRTDPVAAQSAVQIHQRAIAVAVGRCQRQLRVEQVALGVQHVDVIGIAVVVALDRQL